jgi:hypothetical protein
MMVVSFARQGDEEEEEEEVALNGVSVVLVV